MRGRRNKDKPQGNDSLPPCRVCGEPGSGFHYGVTTCGACKGFFRRCLVRKEPYTCMESDLCIVGPSTSRRDSCPKCRYDKCVAVGMSKDACKVGRYSLMKKSKDEKEVMEHKTALGKSSAGSDVSVNKLLRSDESSDVSVNKVLRSDEGSDVSVNKVLRSDEGSDVSVNKVLRSDEGSDVSVNKVLRSDEGRDVSVNKVLRSDEAEKEMTHLTSRLESTTEELFYNNFNNFEVSNELCSPYIVSFRTDEAMKWNLEGQGKESQNDSDNNASSNHDERKCIDDIYDETLSISSCFLGVNYGNKLSSDESPADTLASDKFESRDNCVSEPCYTVLRAPAQMDTVPSLVNVDTSKTTYLGFLPNSGMAFSPSSFIQHMDVSPTIPHIHNSKVDTSISFSYSNEELSHCSHMKVTKLEHDMSEYDEYIRNQQPFSLTSIHSRHENQDSVMPSNSDQNVTQMPDQHNQWSIDHFVAQRFNTEDWIDNNDEQSKDNMPNTSTKTMDVSVHSSHELPIYHSNKSVIQSVGRPDSFNDVFPFLRRSFDEDPNFNNNNLQMPMTKESRDNHVTTVISTENLKRKYEHESDDDNPKKRCTMKGPQRQSIIKLQPIKEKRDSLAFESGETSLLKSTFLLYMHPNLSNYALSVFDRFPFICYEKESLGSLLNHCYEVNDSLLECMALSKSQSETNTDNTLISNSSFATVLANAYSQRMPCHTLPVTYDENKMDELFFHLMDIHKRHIKDGLSFMTESEIQSAQELFLGLCHLKEKVHGQMKFIEDEKYFTILETTGIDVDKRKEYLLTYINPMEDYLPKIIKFFRAIPGFGDFTLADKITLTKGRLPIYHFLSTHRGTDTVKQICIDEVSGVAIRLKNINELFPSLDNMSPQLSDIINELKSLKLSMEEIVVLKALMLTWPEEGWLEQPDVVEACHKQYVHCLLNRLRKRYNSQADERFSKIVGMLHYSMALSRQFKLHSQGELTELISRVLDTGAVPLFKEACLNQSNKKKRTGCGKMKSIVV